MSYNKPIDVGACVNIAPIPNLIHYDNVPNQSEYIPVILHGTANQLLEGDELLLTLKYDCEFGRAGEYISMPIEGYVYSAFLGSIAGRNGDLSTVGTNVGYSYYSNVLSFLPGNNYAVVNNVIGSSFQPYILDIKSVIIGNTTTISIKVSQGYSITTPFNVLLVDLTYLRKYSINTKP